MLVDKGLAVAKKYDAVSLGLVVNRTVVGIGTDGKIVYYKRGSPSTDEILKALS